MIFTDTHSHLYLNDFQKDLQEVLQRACEADVRHIFLPAIQWESLRQMDALDHPEIRFYKMAGIHPGSIHETGLPDEQQLFDHAASDDIVGVGETGLDYYWSREYVSEQKESLSIHCRVAKAVSKPIILHNRDSTDDLLDQIEAEQDGSLKGIWHCFTGSAEEGKRAVDLGLYLGIGGILTFKNSGLDRIVGQLDPDRLLLETDAPYLTPVPNRGKRNEPAYMRYTAEKLAEITGVSLKEIAEKTTENAFRLFGLNPEF